MVMTMIGSQIYRYLTDRHDTQEAVLCSINEDISFQGVIVRDETQITYGGDGVISYMYADGSKVAKGAVIAKSFDSEQAATAESRLSDVEEEISQLERAQNPGTTDYVQPESINSKISDYYKQLAAYANDGDYESFESVKSNMSLVMNIYNIISGISDDYNTKIAELTAEKEQLEAQAAQVKDSVAATQTGYFVSYCDGYENSLTKEKALTLTQSEIEDIVSGKSDSDNRAPSDALGKIFTDYSCSIVGVIDSDSRVAQDVTLQLALDSSDTVYDVTVLSVTEADEEGKSVVVLSCDSLDEALVLKRVQSMQLIFDDYQGLKVPRSAIRFRDGQKGVYVILGQDITFKKIDVIYEGDDFVLSSNTSDESSLLLYDQILLEVVSEQDVQDDDSGGESSVSGDS
jgi:hypothetical protein